MLKKTTLVIILAFLSDLTLECSVSRDFIRGTLEEQTNFAGVIMIGTVKFLSESFGPKSVLLSEIDYYRGCNKNELLIDNFRPDNLCGPGVPSLNDKIIVFACGNGNNKNWSVHQFVPFTGWVKYSEENLAIIKKQTGLALPLDCNNNVFFERCMKRDLEICSKIKKEPTIMEIEPIMKPVQIQKVPTDYNVFEYKINPRNRSFLSGHINNIVNTY